MKELIYTGSSMLGVFAPGDVLLAEPVCFSEAAPGDIVVFTAPLGPEKQLVHRITSASGGVIRTHGDNNLRPDPVALNHETKLLKIIGCKRGNRRIKVTSGKEGLSEFKRNQRRVHRLHTLAVLLRPLAALAPLRFWAPAKDELEPRNFLRGGTPVKSALFHHGKQVAVYDFQRRVWRPLGRWKLFFSAKSLNSFSPAPPADGEPRPDRD